LMYSASLGSEGLLGPPPTSIVALAVIGSLALAGGLAAFCFAKAIGIALLGEPRTPQASDAREPAGLMILPLILLAAGCAAFALFSPLVVNKLMPVVAQLTHQSAEATAILAAGALGSLAWVAQMSCGLVVIIGGLAVARKLLLAGREVTTSGTWGCGYARPTPRIQYTASSFTQPAVEFFGVLVRSRRQLKAPTGLFPRWGSLSTANTDMSKDLIYRPMFDSIGLALSKLRWLQHGRIHLYILYVGCTILALVIWYASVELAPDNARRVEAISQTTPDL
jgi:hydrogenase-4 component B